MERIAVLENLNLYLLLPLPSKNPALACIIILLDYLDCHLLFSQQYFSECTVNCFIVCDCSIKVSPLPLALPKANVLLIIVSGCSIKISQSFVQGLCMFLFTINALFTPNTFPVK